MKTKWVISVISLLFCLDSIAQQLELRVYDFPDRIPSRYIINPRDEYKEMLKTKPSGLKRDQVERFAEEMSYRKAQSFMSGSLYMGWDELESYLNEVLQGLMPAQYKNNPKIHVYPMRDSEFNAFALHDGTIFFNVSLLAELSNEAALACVLGHELSHYINEDVKKSYVSRINLNTKSNRDKENRKLKALNAYYDRAQERVADSCGAILAAKAGYDISFGAGNFFKFFQLEEQEKEKDRSRHIRQAPRNDSLKTIEERMLSSHPENLERIAYFRNFDRLYNTKSSRTFIAGDEIKFRKLQKQARLELLNSLLSEYDYRQCTSQAFTFYLLEPDNNAYLFYILESIRRFFYINPSVQEKPFLTDDLKEGIFNRGEGILHNLRALIRDSSMYKQLKPTDLADEKMIEFETWDEAFNYFADIAIDRKLKEGYFSIALRNIDTIPLRDQYLKEYLKEPGGTYEDFAKAMLNNTLVSTIEKNSRKIVFFEDLTLLEDHSYGYHNRFLLAEEESSTFENAFESLINKDFSSREYFLYKNQLKEKYNHAIKYRDMMISGALLATFRKKIQNRKELNGKYEDVSFKKSSGNKHDFAKMLFELNPDFWYTMKEDKIHSIEWLKAVAFNDKGKFDLSLLNPFFLLGLSAHNPILSGSNRFAYMIDYSSINPFSDENGVDYNEDIVRYKMTKSNFLNTVYHDLNSLKK